LSTDCEIIEQNPSFHAVFSGDGSVTFRHVSQLFLVEPIYFNFTPVLTYGGPKRRNSGSDCRPKCPL
jgi:hypothetical protein